HHRRLPRPALRVRPIARSGTDAKRADPTFPRNIMAAWGEERAGHRAGSWWPTSRGGGLTYTKLGERLLEEKLLRTQIQDSQHPNGDDPAIAPPAVLRRMRRRWRSPRLRMIYRRGQREGGGREMRQFH